MIPHLVTDEVRYRLLQYLEDHPEASQRELARHLGASVGKINYCVRALIAKGLVKMRNFHGSRTKLRYVYVLTPKGIEERLNVTMRFLRHKIEEFDRLSQEIEKLTQELDERGATYTRSVRSES